MARRRDESRNVKFATRGTLIAFVIAAIATGAAGCGVGEGTPTTEPFRKVAPADRSYSLDDFLVIGYKKSKEYDVDGLPEAAGAWFGFWRPPGRDPVEYELRFYPSHEAAVEHGTALAEEVTGKDAVIFEDDVTWKEGIRDRRAQARYPYAGLHARYGDFAIFGNVVMLCEGRDSTQSLERCEAIVDALRASNSE